MHRSAKLIFIGIIFTALFLISTSVSFAVSRTYSIGPLKVKPALEISAEYNSNAELKSGGEDDELVANVIPSIGLSFGSDILKRDTRRLYFDTNYSTEYRKITGGDNQFFHNIDGVLRYNISPITSIGISDRYTVGPTGPSDNDREYNHNSATGSIKHLFGNRLAVTAGYTMDNYDEETGDEYSDYEDEIPFVGINYKFSPKTTFTLDGSYIDRDFDNVSNKDYDGYDANFGIQRRLTSRSTVGLNVGYVERDYTEDSLEAQPNDDIEDITYGATFTSNLTNLSVLKVNYTHAIQDTYYRMANLVGFVSPVASFNREKGYVTSLDQQYKAIDTDHIDATLYLNLNEKNALFLDGAYMESSAASSLGIGDATHTGNDLDEEAYVIGAGYNRKLNQYLTLGLKSAYGERESNVRGDYDYWAVSFVTKLAF